MANHYVIEVTGINFKPQYFTSVAAIAEHLGIQTCTIYKYLNKGKSNNCGYKFRTVFSKNSEIMHVNTNPCCNYILWAS